jgi:hypothetical protein
LFLHHHPLPTAHFPQHGLSAILLCRVMHFFKPEEVELMFQKAKRWLIPQGRFYIVTMTPHHYVLKNFLNVYQKRLETGNPWPGVITTMSTDYGIEHAGKIPEYLHVFDSELILRLAKKHGFLIKKLELFGHHRNPDPIKDNDLGYIGVVLINQNE